MIHGARNTGELEGAELQWEKREDAQGVPDPVEADAWEAGGEGSGWCRCGRLPVADTRTPHLFRRVASSIVLSSLALEKVVSDALSCQQHQEHGYART